MKYAISVKLDTLACTKLEFEEILKNMGRYIYVNDSLWFVECTLEFDKSAQNIFFRYFENITNEKSHILVSQISNTSSYYGELPNEAASFLDS
ncbi:hypothetical protein CS063_15040 [Sporanaerobium hydrogeniformans]|uniref:Uncharacterized protein n=1 Tax=Sporanaerobium hydrogeniformans TaxID=3072179 RepID=A0AC61D7N8_9FIRM|nr:hypothetical protein [Sporanaerobium hydrogeniformans]PHV69559.1 hypothetical protein CS063_15040 [Sporanaerobium hydrogeniformans]